MDSHGLDVVTDPTVPPGHAYLMPPGGHVHLGPDLGQPRTPAEWRAAALAGLRARETTGIDDPAPRATVTITAPPDA